MQKSELATYGEQTALAFLQSKGIVVIDANYRTSAGEIDLIGKEGERFIFFEVKTRQSDRYGFPEEAVSATKLEHIIAVAWEYFEDHQIDGVDWQIDVIAIRRDLRNDRTEIKWIQNVVA